MVSRRRAGILLVLLLFLPAVIFIGRAPARPYSSPTAIRTNDTYALAHAPATNFPTVREDLFSSIELQRSETGITVTLPSEPLPPFPVVYGSVTEHRVEANQVIRIGDGSIRLAYIGTATEPLERKGTGPMLRARGRFYTPDLKPITADDRLARGPAYRRELIAHSLPSARFIFAVSNIAEFQVGWFRTFDARTHYSLSRSLNLSANSNTFTFNTDVTLWHQTPIELVGVIGVGPAETHRLNLAEGAELNIPGAELKLLAMVDGTLQVTDNSLSGGKESTSMKVHGPLLPGRPGEFSLLLYCWPPAESLPLTLEAQYHSGKIISPGFRELSAGLLTVELFGKPQEIRELTVKYFRNQHRLIVTLPELPGLPEENRNLQNLFDVRVPHLDLKDPLGLEHGLGHLVQMRVGYIPRKYAGWSARMDPTNTTALAVLQQLEQDLSTKYDHLVVDSERNEIRVQLHFLSIPIIFFQQLIGR
jgi:hypothetical protein